MFSLFINAIFLIISILITIADRVSSKPSQSVFMFKNYRKIKEVNDYQIPKGDELLPKERLTLCKNIANSTYFRMNGYKFVDGVPVDGEKTYKITSHSYWDTQELISAFQCPVDPPVYVRHQGKMVVVIIERPKYKGCSEKDFYRKSRTNRTWIQKVFRRVERIIGVRPYYKKIRNIHDFFCLGGNTGIAHAIDFADSYELPEDDLENKIQSVAAKVGHNDEMDKILANVGGITHILNRISHTLDNLGNNIRPDIQHFEENSSDENNAPINSHNKVSENMPSANKESKNPENNIPPEKVQSSALIHSKVNNEDNLESNPEKNHTEPLTSINSENSSGRKFNKSNETENIITPTKDQEPPTLDKIVKNQSSHETNPEKSSVEPSAVQSMKSNDSSKGGVDDSNTNDKVDTSEKDPQTDIKLYKDNESHQSENISLLVKPENNNDDTKVSFQKVDHELPNYNDDNDDDDRPIMNIHNKKEDKAESNLDSEIDPGTIKMHEENKKIANSNSLTQSSGNLEGNINNGPNFKLHSEESYSEPLTNVKGNTDNSAENQYGSSNISSPINPKSDVNNLKENENLGKVPTSINLENNHPSVIVDRNTGLDERQYFEPVVNFDNQDNENTENNFDNGNDQKEGKASDSLEDSKNHSLKKGAPVPVTDVQGNIDSKVDTEMAIEKKKAELPEINNSKESRINGGIDEQPRNEDALGSNERENSQEQISNVRLAKDGAQNEEVTNPTIGNDYYEEKNTIESNNTRPQTSQDDLKNEVKDENTQSEVLLTNNPSLLNGSSDPVKENLMEESEPSLEESRTWAGSTDIKHEGDPQSNSSLLKNFGNGINPEKVGHEFSQYKNDTKIQPLEVSDSREKSQNLQNDSNNSNIQLGVDPRHNNNKEEFGDIQNKVPLKDDTPSLKKDKEDLMTQEANHEIDEEENNTKLMESNQNVEYDKGDLAGNNNEELREIQNKAPAEGNTLSPAIHQVDPINPEGNSEISQEENSTKPLESIQHLQHYENDHMGINDEELGEIPNKPLTESVSLSLEKYKGDTIAQEVNPETSQEESNTEQQASSNKDNGNNQSAQYDRNEQQANNEEVLREIQNEASAESDFFLPEDPKVDTTPEVNLENSEEKSSTKSLERNKHVEHEEGDLASNNKEELREVPNKPSGESNSWSQENHNEDTITQEVNPEISQKESNTEPKEKDNNDGNGPNPQSGRDYLKGNNEEEIREIPNKATIDGDSLSLKNHKENIETPKVNSEISQEESSTKLLERNQHLEHGKDDLTRNNEEELRGIINEPPAESDSLLPAKYKGDTRTPKVNPETSLVESSTEPLESDNNDRSSQNLEYDRDNPEGKNMEELIQNEATPESDSLSPENHKGNQITPKVNSRISIKPLERNQNLKHDKDDLARNNEEELSGIINEPPTESDSLLPAKYKGDTRTQEVYPETSQEESNTKPLESNKDDENRRYLEYDRDDLQGNNEEELREIQNDAPPERDSSSPKNQNGDIVTPAVNLETSQEDKELTEIPKQPPTESDFYKRGTMTQEVNPKKSQEESSIEPVEIGNKYDGHSQNTQYDKDKLQGNNEEELREIQNVAPPESNSLSPENIKGDSMTLDANSEINQEESSTKPQERSQNLQYDGGDLDGNAMLGIEPKIINNEGKLGDILNEAPTGSNSFSPEDHHKEDTIIQEVNSVVSKEESRSIPLESSQNQQYNGDYSKLQSYVDSGKTNNDEELADIQNEISVERYSLSQEANKQDTVIQKINSEISQESTIKPQISTDGEKPQNLQYNRHDPDCNLELGPVDSGNNINEDIQKEVPHERGSLLEENHKGDTKTPEISQKESNTELLESDKNDGNSKNPQSDRDDLEGNNKEGVTEIPNEATTESDSVSLKNNKGDTIVPEVNLEISQEKSSTKPLERNQHLEHGKDDLARNNEDELGKIPNEPPAKNDSLSPEKFEGDTNTQEVYPETSQEENNTKPLESNKNNKNSQNSEDDRDNLQGNNEEELREIQNEAPPEGDPSSPEDHKGDIITPEVNSETSQEESSNKQLESNQHLKHYEDDLVGTNRNPNELPAESDSLLPEKYKRGTMMQEVNQEPSQEKSNTKPLESNKYDRNNQNPQYYRGDLEGNNKEEVREIPNEATVESDSISLKNHKEDTIIPKVNLEISQEESNAKPLERNQLLEHDKDYLANNNEKELGKISHEPHAESNSLSLEKYKGNAITQEVKQETSLVESNTEPLENSNNDRPSKNLEYDRDDPKGKNKRELIWNEAPPVSDSLLENQKGDTIIPEVNLEMSQEESSTKPLKSNQHVECNEDDLGGTNGEELGEIDSLSPKKYKGGTITQEVDPGTRQVESNTEPLESGNNNGISSQNLEFDRDNPAGKNKEELIQNEAPLESNSLLENQKEDMIIPEVDSEIGQKKSSTKPLESNQHVDHDEDDLAGINGNPSEPPAESDSLSPEKYKGDTITQEVDPQTSQVESNTELLESGNNNGISSQNLEFDRDDPAGKNKEELIQNEAPLQSDSLLENQKEDMIIPEVNSEIGQEENSTKPLESNQHVDHDEDDLAGINGNPNEPPAESDSLSPEKYKGDTITQEVDPGTSQVKSNTELLESGNNNGISSQNLEFDRDNPAGKNKEELIQNEAPLESDSLLENQKEDMIIPEVNSEIGQEESSTKPLESNQHVDHDEDDLAGINGNPSEPPAESDSLSPEKYKGDTITQEVDPGTSQVESNTEPLESGNNNGISSQNLEFDRDDPAGKNKEELIQNEAPLESDSSLENQKEDMIIPEVNSEIGQEESSTKPLESNQHVDHDDDLAGINGNPNEPPAKSDSLSPEKYKGDTITQEVDPQTSQVESNTEPLESGNNNGISSQNLEFDRDDPAGKNKEELIQNEAPLQSDSLLENQKEDMIIPEVNSEIDQEESSTKPLKSNQHVDHNEDNLTGINGNLNEPPAESDSLSPEKYKGDTITQEVDPGISQVESNTEPLESGNNNGISSQNLEFDRDDPAGKNKEELIPNEAPLESDSSLENQKEDMIIPEVNSEIGQEESSTKPLESNQHVDHDEDDLAGINGNPNEPPAESDSLSPEKYKGDTITQEVDPGTSQVKSNTEPLESGNNNGISSQNLEFDRDDPAGKNKEELIQNEAPLESDSLLENQKEDMIIPEVNSEIGQEESSTKPLESNQHVDHDEDDLAGINGNPNEPPAESDSLSPEKYKGGTVLQEVNQETSQEERNTKSLENNKDDGNSQNHEYDRDDVQGNNEEEFREIQNKALPESNNLSPENHKGDSIIHEVHPEISPEGSMTKPLKSTDSLVTDPNVVDSYHKNIGPEFEQLENGPDHLNNNENDRNIGQEDFASGNISPTRNMNNSVDQKVTTNISQERRITVEPVDSNSNTKSILNNIKNTSGTSIKDITPQNEILHHDDLSSYGNMKKEAEQDNVEQKTNQRESDIQTPKTIDKEDLLGSDIHPQIVRDKNNHDAEIGNVKNEDRSIPQKQTW